jgi:hypothetical protein
VGDTGDPTFMPLVAVQPEQASRMARVEGMTGRASKPDPGPCTQAVLGWAAQTDRRTGRRLPPCAFSSVVRAPGVNVHAPGTCRRSRGDDNDPPRQQLMPPGFWFQMVDLLMTLQLLADG